MGIFCLADVTDGIYLFSRCQMTDVDFLFKLMSSVNLCLADVRGRNQMTDGDFLF